MQKRPNIKKPSLKTSARMRAVRQRNTMPERIVRKLICNSGIHYRICQHNLPGSPDIANRKKKWAIFVHGCFWHGHEQCRLATKPKSNRAFWNQKITDNRKRDKKKEEALRGEGLKVLVVWQCELTNMVKLNRRLASFFDKLY